MQNYIYKVDLSNATDITNVKYEEKELNAIYIENKDRYDLIYRNP